MDLFGKEDIKSISKCCSEYKLKDFINMEVLHYGFFKNPNAIHFIEKNLKKYIQEQDIKKYLIIRRLCENPNAMHLIEDLIQTHETVDWKNIFSNPGAVYLIEEKLKIQPEDIDWNSVCKNPNALHLIEKRPKIKYTSLLQNPNAVHIIEKCLDQGRLKNIFNIADVYTNPNLIHLIKEKINIHSKEYWYWPYLCMNPGAVDIIEKKLEIDPEVYSGVWHILCQNPNASHITNTDSVNWSYLCENPSIFELEKYNENILKILNSI
jgi:hypothetical protein